MSWKCDRCKKEYENRAVRWELCDGRLQYEGRKVHFCRGFDGEISYYICGSCMKDFDYWLENHENV